ncbi:MAG: hypothetical protein Q4Q17_03075 [Tissierellia bacterium]|nr:hypothetical protein [Tissierellia bacterium]
MNKSIKSSIGIIALAILLVLFLWFGFFCRPSIHYFGNPLPTREGETSMRSIAINGEIYTLNPGDKTDIQVPRAKELKITKATLYTPDFYTMKTSHKISKKKNHGFIRFPLIRNLQSIKGEPAEIETIILPIEEEDRVTLQLVNGEEKILHEITIQLQ